ncbi:MAG: sugar ABC transporter substrate-binding protein [Bacillota bacterium]
MSWKRLVAGFMLAVFLVGPAGGCSRKPERKPVMPLTKIGLSVADATRDGNVVIRKVMGEKGRAGRVKIIFANAGGDPLRQEKDLERLVKKERVRAVVAQFVDPATAAGMVRRLKEAGVKVVALDTLVPDAPLDAYVAPDHARAGELLAQFVRENLPDGGGAPARVLFLSGDPDNPGMEAVAAAFREFFSGYPQVEVLVENIPQAEPGAVPPLMEGILVRYGNAVNAVAAADSRLAVAAIEVLRARGLVDAVVTAGVGADLRATELLSAGQHEAEVDVQPEILGGAALTAAVELVKKGEWRYETRVPNGDLSVPAQLVPVRLIRPESLYLLTERWQKYGGGGGSGSSSGGAGKKKNEQGGGSKGAGGGSGKQTRLRITTQDGRTVEVEIPGEIKKIETVQ